VSVATALPEEALAPATRRHREWIIGGAQALAGLLGMWLFALGTRTSHGQKSLFSFTYEGGGGTTVPDLTVPAETGALLFTALCVAFGLVRALLPLSRGWRVAATSGYLVCMVIAFLVWADASPTPPAGSSRIALNVAGGLFYFTLLAAVPLVLGALSGVLCERSAVINIAIEGQFLVGACAASYAASVTGNVWVGLVCGIVAGGLIGWLLAVLSQRYLIQQVVLGVVLNLLASGLTGFFYDRVMAQNSDSYNNSQYVLKTIKIPGLVKIPVIGAVMFNENVIVYATYVLIIVVHVGLFRTRWGLRTRAVGEHPTAADTVGIKVLRTRYRNVIAGGLLAGLGGAWLTVGQVGAFTKDMSSGKGYIALAAVVFGRWSPLGAVGAALLFGFADAIAQSGLNTPIPANVLSMAPYLATVFAVAGLVGRVRAPAADGQPYVKG
jgi:ABC-type uncharacterized transport system permease subunit